MSVISGILILAIVFWGLIVVSNHWKNTVKLHLKTYRRLKKAHPEMKENKLLGELLLTRLSTVSIMPSGRRQKEIDYYTSVLRQRNKKLADVIYALIDYDYVIDRKWLPDYDEITKFRSEIKSYVEKSIKEQFK